MSRISLIVILGVGASIMIGITMALALIVGRSYFMIADRDVQVNTPVPLIVATAVADNTAAPTSQPVEPTASATAAATPSATAIPPTSVAVLQTSVQYIMAEADVNIRSGPGTGYKIIGWIAEGQTAKVTGISSENAWWRVVCPDGTTGSCWTTALTQYTRPTTSPGGQTPPTATACTNAATFVADVTVPDGSQLMANSTFVKTWRIQNSGTCTWDGRYQLVHVGGPTLGAVVESLAMPAVVAPNQTIDLSVTMLAPVTSGSYQSNWKLLSPQGVFFGVGRTGSPLWVKINVAAPSTNSTISGLVYQDSNQNGVYESGEPLMSNREVALIPGTACHVRQSAVAVTLSGADGRYSFNGNFSGSFCVGLSGSDGLDDVASITIGSGQTMNNIHLKAPVANATITGWLWNDYCLPNSDGSTFTGNCVPDGTGSYRADGMIQPTETYISGVTILLHAGSCAVNNIKVAAITDANGKYVFNNLSPGIYCVSMNAAEGGNAAKLLPGDWTFPANGIWYH